MREVCGLVRVGDQIEEAAPSAGVAGEAGPAVGALTYEAKHQLVRRRPLAAPHLDHCVGRQRQHAAPAQHTWPRSDARPVLRGGHAEPLDYVVKRLSARRAPSPPRAAPSRIAEVNCAARVASTPPRRAAAILAGCVSSCSVRAASGVPSSHAGHMLRPSTGGTAAGPSPRPSPCRMGATPPVWHSVAYL